MLRKALIALCATAIMVVTTLVVGSAAAGVAPSLAVIDADSACPVTGCASGTCHGYDDVPEPDGTHQMSCPETSCASVDCHAWGVLRGRYHKASDASLNLWVLFPVALFGGLILLLRRI